MLTKVRFIYCESLMKSNGKSSDICWYVWIWTKVKDQRSQQSDPRAMTLAWLKPTEVDCTVQTLLCQFKPLFQFQLVNHVYDRISAFVE